MSVISLSIHPGAAWNRLIIACQDSRLGLFSSGTASHIGASWLVRIRQGFSGTRTAHVVMHRGQRRSCPISQHSSANRGIPRPLCYCQAAYSLQPLQAPALVLPDWAHPSHRLFTLTLTMMPFLSPLLICIVDTAQALRSASSSPATVRLQTGAIWAWGGRSVLLAFEWIKCL